MPYFKISVVILTIAIALAGCQSVKRVKGNRNGVISVPRMAY